MATAIRMMETSRGRAARQRPRPWANPGRGLTVSKPTCSIDGCNGTSSTRGWCTKHYQRWRKYGNPEHQVRLMTQHGATLEERVWAKVERRDPTECWPWTDTLTDDGYGRIRVGTQRIGAHRAMWTITHGEIENGLVVCHHCDNPRCCNPGHLFLGTPGDNARDKVSKGRQRNPTGDAHGTRTMPHRVSRGENRPQSKLTEADVKEIRARYGDGESFANLARKYGVTPSVIAKVARREGWRHVQ
jgi:hypothetical protein